MAMLTKAIAFLIGVSSLMWFSQLPIWYNLLWAFILIVGFYFIVPKRFHFIIHLLFIGLLGLSWSTWLTSHRLQWSLPERFEGKDVQVTGIIASLPSQQGDKTSFVFKSSLSITYVTGEPPTASHVSSLNNIATNLPLSNC